MNKNNSLLKFRVWSKKYQMFDNNPMWPSNQRTSEIFLLDGNGELRTFITTDGENYFWDLTNYEKGDLIVQRYTGLKDENNKEIYEGDIMASRGNYITDTMDENGNFIDIYNVVVWNQKMTRFALKPIDEYLNELKNPINPELDHPWVCSIDTFKEVIGNICENPDMLSKLLRKQKKEEKAAQKHLDDITKECPNCFNNSLIDGYCNECGCENR